MIYKGILDHFYCECGGEKTELLGGTLGGIGNPQV